MDKIYFKDNEVFWAVQVMKVKKMVLQSLVFVLLSYLTFNAYANSNDQSNFRAISGDV